MTANEEDWGGGSRRGDRKESLLKATFDIVAAEGFEGLRTRAIATRAGVNIATLHYYYPTKEELIGDFALYLGELFQSTHAPPVPSTGRPGLDRLRQEFADAAFLLTDRQDLLVVLREVELRATRDAVVKQHLDLTLRYWRQHLRDLVKAGLEDGSFRPEVDLDQATSTLLALFNGLPSVGPEGVQSIQQMVEQWLVRPEAGA